MFVICTVEDAYEIVGFDPETMINVFWTDDPSTFAPPPGHSMPVARGNNVEDLLPWLHDGHVPEPGESSEDWEQVLREKIAVVNVGRGPISMVGELSPVDWAVSPREERDPLKKIAQQKADLGWVGRLIYCLVTLPIGLFGFLGLLMAVTPWLDGMHRTPVPGGIIFAVSILVVFDGLMHFGKVPRVPMAGALTLGWMALYPLILIGYWVFNLPRPPFRRGRDILYWLSPYARPREEAEEEAENPAEARPAA